jgi:uncharacterized protein (TIGR00369 family)
VAPRITLESFAAMMREAMPFAAALDIATLATSEGTATLRLPFRADFLRPGGTVGGPLPMGLADVTMYAAVLSVTGAAASVTANLNVTFLRKPAPMPVVAEARVIRHGRRLVYGEIALFSEGDPKTIAHATASYALPTGRPAPVARLRPRSAILGIEPFRGGEEPGDVLGHRGDARRLPQLLADHQPDVEAQHRLFLHHAS